MISSNSHGGQARTRLALGSLVVLGALALGAAAPSASGSSGGSAATTAAIKTNWTLFFKGTTPAAQKEKLLQNGSKFAAFLKVQAKSAAAKETTVKVTKVKITSKTSATVIYTIYISGTPAEPNASGKAILENKVWVVSDTSFCALVSLEGAAPKACK
ncbi:MAG: hypothetical protein ABSA31_00545 [Acidimicrobiales bacterium]|jgi:hypothetical protein